MMTEVSVVLLRVWIRGRVEFVFVLPRDRLADERNSNPVPHIRKIEVYSFKRS